MQPVACAGANVPARAQFRSGHIAWQRYNARMAATAFDTFEAARALECAGVERTQAEAIAEAIQQRQDYASKEDVTRQGTALRTEIHELGTELRGRIDKLEADLRGKIDKLAAQVAELRSEMSALETRVMNRIYVIAIGQAGLIAVFGLFT